MCVCVTCMCVCVCRVCVVCVECIDPRCAGLLLCVCVYVCVCRVSCVCVCVCLSAADDNFLHRSCARRNSLSTFSRPISFSATGTTRPTPSGRAPSRDYTQTTAPRPPALVPEGRQVLAPEVGRALAPEGGRALALEGGRAVAPEGGRALVLEGGRAPPMTPLAYTPLPGRPCTATSISGRTSLPTTSGCGR